MECFSTKMKYYFLLQYERLKRFITYSGINFFLAIIIAIVGFILLSHLIFGKINYAEYVYAASCIFFVNLLGKHDRNNFLKTIYTKSNYRKIRLIENSLAAIPFVLFLVYNQNYLTAICLLVLAVIFSFFNTLKRIYYAFPTPFYKRPFEFIAGFRKFFWLFLLSYILTIIAIEVDNFNLGIFAILITAFTCVGFYNKSEPSFFVWIYNTTPTGFLKQKSVTAIFFYSLLCLPIVITLIIFNLNYWYITLIFYFIGNLYVLVSLLGKYAYFPSEINVIQGFAIGFSIAFPPLLVIIIPIFYSKSKQKLSAFLK